MKKLTSLVAVFALTAAMFAGCQSQKDVTIDVSALADTLKSDVSFVDSLSEPGDAAFSRIYDVNNADVATKKVYVSSGATAEEIAVFEAVDEAAVGRIRTAVDTRVADQLANFADYNPVEQKKLNDPVIEQTGKYVILCVSDNNDAARKCIKKFTK